MTGGLPDWFRVSDRQLLRLRHRIGQAAGIIAFASAGAIWATSSGRDIQDEIFMSLFLATFLSLSLGFIVSFLIPTHRLRLFWLSMPTSLLIVLSFFTLNISIIFLATLFSILFIYANLRMEEFFFWKNWFPSLLYSDLTDRGISERVGGP